MFSFRRKREPERPGHIWLDAPDAHRAIDRRWRNGEVTAAEAANLRKFADDGYLIIAIDFTESDAAELSRQIDRLWREKPANVAFAYDSPATALLSG